MDHGENKVRLKHLGCSEVRAELGCPPGPANMLVPLHVGSHETPCMWGRRCEGKSMSMRCCELVWNQAPLRNVIAGVIDHLTPTPSLAGAVGRINMWRTRQQAIQPPGARPSCLRELRAGLSLPNVQHLKSSPAAGCSHVPGTACVDRFDRARATQDCKPHS